MSMTGTMFLIAERDELLAKVNKLDAELAKRDAENEKLHAGFLKLRVALGLDLHSTDNLLDVAAALKAENLGYAKSLLDLEAEVKRLRRLLEQVVKDHGDVRGLHVYNNLQVIPASENLRKHNHFEMDL